jgi:hypothetical protein
MKLDYTLIWNPTMTIADQIHEIVKTLPPEQANQVLTFAEFIRSRCEGTEQPEVTEGSGEWFQEPIQSVANRTFR